jgi:hypothetical protein
MKVILNSKINIGNNVVNLMIEGGKVQRCKGAKVQRWKGGKVH